MNKKIFSQEMEDWNKNFEFYFKDSGGPFQKIIRDEIDLVYNLNNQDIVLDAGCGTKPTSKDSVSIDFSINMLLEAKNKNPSGNFILCSVHSLPFKSDVFDTVVSNGLFHHAKVQGIFDDCIKEFNRVLKKNGKLCIFDRSDSFIPNFFFYLRKPIKLIFKSKSQCSTRNESVFVEKDVKKILEGGFYIEKRKYVVTLPFQFMIIATNVIHYIFGFSLARSIQNKLKKIGRFLEIHLSFKSLCAEQCIKMEKMS